MGNVRDPAQPQTAQAADARESRPVAPAGVLALQRAIGNAAIREAL